LAQVAVTVKDAAANTSRVPTSNHPRRHARDHRQTTGIRLANATLAATLNKAQTCV
jgi:hypothetical protein